MKHLTLLAIILIGFSACKKGSKSDDSGIIVEPPLQRMISSDTITTGGLWGLNVGQSPTDLYTKIQQIRAEHSIGGMGIVGNVFTSIDSLKTRLPLYTAIFMDEQKGTSTGVQLAFANGKVNSMFNNNGDKLTGWPFDTDQSTAIHIGDQVSTLYAKLVKIKQTSGSANKLERLSIFSKDISTAYDPQMSVSPQWYFTSQLTPKRYNHLQLIFKDGKLAAIYSVVIESE